MTMHPELTDRFIKMRVDDLRENRNHTRTVVMDRPTEVRRSGTRERMTFLSEIELTFWKRWRVRRPTLRST